MNILLNQQHAWAFALALAALLFIAFRLYRRVPPSVSAALRLVLLSLRTAALVVVILVLLEPVVRLSRAHTERPIVAVLLDTSRSMSTRDGTGGMSRGEEAVELLNQVVLPRVARDAEVRAFGFDLELARLDADGSSISEMPSFEGTATDIPSALGALRTEVPEGLAAVVLATDGANNRGGSLVDAWRPLGAPVYALGVGSEEETKDISVREVLTNRISYVGESLPIEATIVSAGFAGGETTVELVSDGRVVDRASVGLSGTGEEAVVRFTAVPASPGVRRYAVQVPPVPGELSQANNRRVVATNVMGGKIEALVVAARPGWDFAFTRRELWSDDNVELTSWVKLEGSEVGRSGDLPGSVEELLAYDVVVIVEPDDGAPGIPPEWLDRFVRERGGGLLVLGAAQAVSRELSDVLPFAGPPARSRALIEKRLRLTGSGEASPLMRLADVRVENSELWTSLPPVWIDAGGPLEIEQDATVLAEAAGADGVAVPVIVTQRVGGGNILALAASGVWRWKMASQSAPDVFGRLVGNAVRWLTARGDLSRVAVSTDESVYPAGETVRLSAQVYRSDYRLARDATVTVDISTAERAAPTESVVLSADGDFYRGEAGPLPPGRYVFRAEAMVRGEQIGDDSGEFLVEEFSLEDAETRRRPGTLRRLADESGGVYLAPESTDDLPESVTLERRSVHVRREFELWNSPWPLIVLVGLLSAEWALRRSKGMP